MNAAITSLEPDAVVLLQEVPGSRDHRCSRPAGPGDGALFRMSAMPPVIGSRSLNATRNGRSRPPAAARPRGWLAPPGRPRGGHQAGHGPRPGEEASPGNGARRRRRARSRAASCLAPGLDQPRYAQRRCGTHDLAEPQPDVRHGMIPGGQAGVRRHHTREPVRMLGDQPQPDHAAPVLPDQGQPAQLQPVEGERADPFHVPCIAVVGDRGRLVRPAEPDQVGGDRPETGLGQHRHHGAVQERPARLPVQQQHRLAVGGPGLHVGHPQVADVHVTRVVANARQARKAMVGGTEDAHPVMMSRRGQRLR